MGSGPICDHIVTLEPGARARSQLTDPSDDVWKALSDPTRRRMLDELRTGPLPTGRLAERFVMTRFGVMKHLRVLQGAGLVLVEERGRERWNHLNPAPIREIYRRWIRPFEEPASDRLLRLKAVVEREHAKKQEGKQ